MEKINSGLTKEIEGLLNEFLGQEEAANFFQGLNQDVSDKQKAITKLVRKINFSLAQKYLLV